MFKDLFIAIASGVIGVLPVVPVPAVVVTTTDIEASVIQYIENHEDHIVTVDCNFDGKEVSVKEHSPQDFTCLTTDIENSEQFNTAITLSAIDGKVSITAVIDEVPDLVIAETPATPKKE